MYRVGACLALAEGVISRFVVGSLCDNSAGILLHVPFTLVTPNTPSTTNLLCRSLPASQTTFCTRSRGSDAMIQCEFGGAHVFLVFAEVLNTVTGKGHLLQNKYSRKSTENPSYRPQAEFHVIFRMHVHRSQVLGFSWITACAPSVRTVL